MVSDPKAVLAEYDMAIPDGMGVKMVESDDDGVHITLPVPTSGHGEVSEKESSDAAAGHCLAWITCFYTCLPSD